MYTAGGGGGGVRIILKRAKLLKTPPPPHHTKCFDNPLLDQRKKKLQGSSPSPHSPPSLDKESKIWAVFMVKQKQSIGNQRFTEFCISGVKKVVIFL